MSHLESLLTKLASDEFDESETEEAWGTHEIPMDSPEPFIEGARWQHQQSHARMSLLVEMVRVQREALVIVGRGLTKAQNVFDAANNEQSVDMTSGYIGKIHQTLAKIEAMAKERG